MLKTPSQFWRFGKRHLNSGVLENAICSGVLENAISVLAFWKTPSQFWRFGKRHHNILQYFVLVM
jgi:hypothetical protein